MSTIHKERIIYKEILYSIINI